MKKLCLILAVILCLCSIIACTPAADDNNDQTTTEDITPDAAATTTKKQAEETPDPEPEPEPIEIDYGTANMKEDGKEYHIESLVIPTNSKNIDEAHGYLIDNTAQSNNDYRYCDGYGYVIYKVDLSEMIEPTIDLLILQNYVVSIAAYDDVDYYQVVLDYSEEHPSTLTTGGNDITYTIDPYSYGFYKEIYIMISDTITSDGWGGTIRSLTINQYVEGAGEDVSTTLE